MWVRKQVTQRKKVTSERDLRGRQSYAVRIVKSYAQMSRVLCFVACIALLGASTTSPILHPVHPRGLDFRLQNSPTPHKYLIETMPGGIALFDYNNDGLLDIFLVNAGDTTKAVGGVAGFDRSNPKYWNRLYRQNKDGSFTDVTQQAGLATADDRNYGMGVAIGDYDNDGNEDIFVTNYGQNVLYHNNGNGTFTDVTAKAGVAGGGWSASAGFVDYDNDGNLDLFVTRYLDWDFKRSKACGENKDTYCQPGEFPPVSNLLYHNRGDGTFEDVSIRSGIAALKGHGLGVAFADYDGDGLTDIFVANDVVEQFLLHNNGNGTFTERALDAGVALSSEGKMLSGMGVTFQDYDNDGRPDIMLTQLPKGLYPVFRNEGNGVFSDQTLSTGFGLLSGSVSGWGMGLEDSDNDGWKDVFIAQSHVIDNVEKFDPGLRYLQPPLLALNHRGRFEQVDPGTNTPLAGRGAAFGDINNDGYVDVVMTVLGGAPQVFMNQASGNHWITVSLCGTRSNRDGLGARVEVNGQVRFATTAGSYLSSSDKRLHFGLGSATRANIEVLWPSGIRQQIAGADIDQILKVQEPKQR